MKTCESCRFFFNHKPFGECRRYPPTKGIIQWPEVDKDQWCGEWQNIMTFKDIADILDPRPSMYLDIEDGPIP